MEDYIEMIYRLSKDSGFTRVNDLSSSLNVKPPSATKMLKKLVSLDIAIAPKYGFIKLTKKGNDYGYFLLSRHETVEKFLSLIGVSHSLLEETEKIEHVLNTETLSCIMNLMDILKDNPKIINELNKNGLK